MKNKLSVVIALVVLVIGFFVAKEVYSSSEEKRLQSLASKDGAPFVREHSYRFGTGDIAVVEYLDPLCGACAAFHPYAKRVFKEYSDEIAVSIRYLDNHQSSKYVIKIIESARKQNKYQEVLDIILNTQASWAENNQPKRIWQILPQVSGLDVQKLRSDFESLQIDDMLIQDRTDASTLAVRGTPSFFVNGKKLETLSYEALLDLVELEIYDKE